MAQLFTDVEQEESDDVEQSKKPKELKEKDPVQKLIDRREEIKKNHEAKISVINLRLSKLVLDLFGTEQKGVKLDGAVDKLIYVLADIDIRDHPLGSRTIKVLQEIVRLHQNYVEKEKQLIQDLNLNNDLVYDVLKMLIEQSEKIAELSAENGRLNDYINNKPKVTITPDMVDNWLNDYGKSYIRDYINAIDADDRVKANGCKTKFISGVIKTFSMHANPKNFAIELFTINYAEARKAMKNAALPSNQAPDSPNTTPQGGNTKDKADLLGGAFQ